MAWLSAPKKLLYQMPSKPMITGMFCLERRGAEMLVHLVCAGQQRFEIVHANGDGDGQADGRPQRIATANPIPELEHVLRVDAELDDFFRVGGHGHEMLGDVRFLLRRLPGTSSGRVWALVIVSCVVKVLEATRKSVVSGSTAFSVSADVRAIDVGDEMKTDVGGT